MSWDLRPWRRSPRSARRNCALHPSLERLEDIRLLSSGSEVVTYDKLGDKFILDYNSSSVLIRAEEDYVNGNVSVANYDNNGKLISASLTQHDASGNLIEVIANANGAPVGVGELYTNGNLYVATYDGHNNVTGYATGHKDSSVTVSLTGYTAAGVKTYSIERDASGNVSVYWYGGNGNVTSSAYMTTNAQGDKLYYVFDAQGNLTNFEDDYANGNVLTARFSNGAKNAYNFSTTDAQGDRLHYSFASNGTLTHFEDDLANGNIYAQYYANGAVIGSGIETTDPQGDKFIVMHNNNNVLVYAEAITPDGSIHVRRYDSNGNLVGTDYEFQDSSGNRILYDFSPQGALDYVLKIQPNGVSADASYTNGVLTSSAVVTADSSGNLISTKRDANGNVTGIAVATIHGSGQLLILQYSPQLTLTSWTLYNPDGSIAASTLPNTSDPGFFQDLYYGVLSGQVPNPWASGVFGYNGSAYSFYGIDTSPGAEPAYQEIHDSETPLPTLGFNINPSYLPVGGQDQNLSDLWYGSQTDNGSMEDTDQEYYGPNGYQFYNGSSGGTTNGSSGGTTDNQ